MIGLEYVGATAHIEMWQWFIFYSVDDALSNYLKERILVSFVIRACRIEKKRDRENENDLFSHHLWASKRWWWLSEIYFDSKKSAASFCSILASRFFSLQLLLLQIRRGKKVIGKRKKKRTFRLESGLLIQHATCAL